MTPELEPFSQRIHELRQNGIFVEKGFSFKTLTRVEWVEPRVTQGDVNLATGIHLGEAERKAGLQQGKHAYELHPELPEEKLSKSMELKFIRDKAKEFLATPEGEEFLKTSPPSKLLWNAQEGLKQFWSSMVKLNQAGHFKDFSTDFSSNNLLFRGFDKNGQPVISVIDQLHRIESKP